MGDPAELEVTAKRRVVSDPEDSDDETLCAASFSLSMTDRPTGIAKRFRTLLLEAASEWAPEVDDTVNGVEPEPDALCSP